ncbi:uncharacterized protein [Channa argus]|uniref:uncharacterized protein isoform X2 n=1 Tax=Channa argus TaxID=215402 RepID=UPI002948969C|nr:hypothetical protein Q8A73_018626 [Channa argus]
MQMLHQFLLAATCLCIYGTPVHLPTITPTQDSRCDGQCVSSVKTVRLVHSTYIKSRPSDSEHVTGLSLNIGVGGATGPQGRPQGINPVTHTENGDSLDDRFGQGEGGREVWSKKREVKKVRSKSKMGDAESQSEVASVLSVESETTEEAVPVINEQKSSSTFGKKQKDIDKSTPRLSLGKFSAFSSSLPELSINSRETMDRSEEERSRLHGEGDSHYGKDPETSLPSSEPPNPSARFHRMTFHSSTPSSMFISTPLTIWGHDGPTISPLPDLLIPEIGPILMPREDGPESLWTEAARTDGADTMVPLSQDEATEGTMSSEALPLIFEPLEDVTLEGAAAAAVVTLMPGSMQPPAAMATRGMPVSEVDLDQLVPVETDRDGPTHTQLLLMPDWTSPWQTSGAELLEPISSLGPSVSQRQATAEPEDHSESGDRVAVRTQNLVDNLPTRGPSRSSFQHSMTTVTMTTRHPEHKSRTRFDEMESEEEPDDDEEEENSEESVEEESEEDLTETPKTSSTQPPYSFIPPPPVWVQRNQGLMRSWVELIREKAGYVSGMLAPVGIGIMGALLIVGALYSIRMIHRKRRNSFKHQRRKQPRETGISQQDQAMLLADSSEDEF